MMKHNTNMSLAEQIAALNNPASSWDPEDASDTDTRAQLSEFKEEITGDDPEIFPSKLRRRAARLFGEDDKRYAGQTTSRRDLDMWEDDGIHNDKERKESFDDVISDDDQMSTHFDGVTSKKRVIRNIADVFKEMTCQLGEESSDGDDEFHVYADKDENSSDSADEDSIDEEEEGVDEAEEEEDDSSSKRLGSGMRAFSDGSIDEEVAKGKATKMQLTLWDVLLENRIKVQKALAIANQLPTYDKQATFTEGGAQVVQEVFRSSSRDLMKLLTKLIDLQQALLQGNQATRHIAYGRNITDQNSDEEITSSDDDDDDDGSKDTPASPRQSNKRGATACLKRKPDVGDFEALLAKRHKDFESFQFETIQKWDDRTRLASDKQSSKSFSSFEKSAVSQIHQVLQDKPRLIKRTQLRRTVYRRIGDTEETDEASQSKQRAEGVNVPINSHLKDYDEETFDDDDFYHQLLRELIDKSTSSTSDPVQLTRQWLEVQKLRRKIKKRVDTKASKGRKIRYDVHPQLVSFMAGRDTGTMMDDAKNELFSSLFGRRQHSVHVHEDMH